jgi:methionyl aminopeptidase
MLSKIIPPSVISLPDADGHFNPFPSFSFTGKLRPVYPLTPRRVVPDRIKLPDYAGNGIPKSEQVGACWKRIGVIQDKD